MAVAHRSSFLNSIWWWLLIICPLAVPCYFGIQRIDSRDRRDGGDAQEAVPAADTEEIAVDGETDSVSLDQSARQIYRERLEQRYGQTPGEADTSRAPEDESGRLKLSGTGSTSEDSVDQRQLTPLRKRDGLYDISFDDIKLDVQPDDPFTSESLTDRVKQLDGNRIRLRGYIRPSFKQHGLKSFVFVRDNKECCFGPGAAIHDCVLVKMKKGDETDYTVRPVTLEGDFYLKEYRAPDGNVWAVYRMKNAQTND